MERHAVPALRGYRPEDFEALFRLDEVCFAPEFRFSRAALRRFAETRRARVVIAELDGRIIGFAITHVEKVTGGCLGYVVTLDVDPGYRKQGIARRLLLNSEATVSGEGCGAMMLHVFTGNAEAIRFYEKLGYERAHTVEHFYGDGLNAFVYRKRLSGGESSIAS